MSKVQHDQLTSAAWYQAEAMRYFWKYLETQEKIEVHEKAAKEAADGSKRAAKFLLEDTRTDPAFAYKDLCTDRKRYMELAQLYATLAIMLK